ncbi:nucleotidyltransferase domain-containing protein [Thermococcus gorgonarius]|uniref:Nucleotidyltransferase n=1 Tax=Thermococcus gorgonarius TaxID=71997 RepID=A0A2Z2M7Z3_THEGO|nr:nucleotidyltransferase domain-containing protein [Thermococcus gorgonarius]ASJ01449.1 nucleotidyltransferase [Thermococcus gorgonarius]
MKEKELIKETVVEVCRELGIGLEDIILFGSRARGDFRKDSDWDILIVTGRELSWRERLHLSGEIRKRLAKRGMPIDVLIISREKLDKLKNDPGYVYSYALSEGIRV